MPDTVEHTAYSMRWPLFTAEHVVSTVWNVVEGGR